MPHRQNGKFPVLGDDQSHAGRPVDYLLEGDLWQSTPSWLEPGDPKNGEWLSIAQVQWRAVQAVLAEYGRRHGAGAWLAQKVEAQASQLQNKLKGSYWLQPHDLTLWAQVVPSMDLSTIVGSDPHLPQKWRALGQNDFGFGPMLLLDDWSAALGRLGTWLEERAAPALLDPGALRLALAECLVAGGVPVSRLVPHEVHAVPTVLGVRWASRLQLVGIIALLSAEHDAARWPAAIRDVHQALIGLRAEPADEVCLLVVLGEALLHQLPWLPSPASIPVLPARLAIATEEMERLDVPTEDLASVDLLARGGAAQTGHLLLCRLASMSP